MTLPSTFDPGSFIIPLGVSSPTLKAGPLPTYVVSYLASFGTIRQQFNEIPLTLCAPALPVRTACTTVLTSTSTAISCATRSGDEQSCVTSLEYITETNTHTPHWPTLNGSFTDLKQTAARLTTQTQKAITVQATAEPVLEPAAVDETDQSGGSGAQTNSSPSTELPQSSIEDDQDSTITQTEATSSTTAATTVGTSPSGTISDSVSEVQGSSPTTGSGSPTADSSTDTSTGAGAGLLIPSWSLSLVVCLAGLWI